MAKFILIEINEDEGSPAVGFLILLIAAIVAFYFFWQNISDTSVYDYPGKFFAAIFHYTLYIPITSTLEFFNHYSTAIQDLTQYKIINKTIDGIFMITILGVPSLLIYQIKYFLLNFYLATGAIWITSVQLYKLFF